MPKKRELVISTIAVISCKTASVDEINSTLNLTRGHQDNSYNPFEHRAINKPNTTLGALIHLWKSSLGIGILAMPNAFKNAGILFGSIMTVVIGIVCTHAVWILVATSHKIQRISKTPVLGYAETAEMVFDYGPPWLKPWSNAAKNFVDYGMMFAYFSGGCTAILFIGSTAHSVCNSLFGWSMSVRIYIVIVMVPIILIGQIRTLRFLVPFSGLSNALTVASFGVVLYYIFKEPLVIEDKPLVASWKTWPMFFSTVIFATTGIGVVMPLENTMSKPQQFLGFPSILLIAMTIITVMYFTMGFFGFIRFGEEVRGSITLNLPTNEWPAILGQILMGIAILLTLGLKFFIPMDILLKKIENSIAKSRILYETLIRIAVMVVMGSLAIAVPDIGLFVSLIGAIFFSILSIFIPAFIETVFLQSYEDYGRLYWKLIKNILLMLFAVIALFSGSFVSIKDIIKTYSEPLTNRN